MRVPLVRRDGLAIVEVDQRDVSNLRATGQIRPWPNEIRDKTLAAPGPVLGRKESGSGAGREASLRVD